MTMTCIYLTVKMSCENNREKILVNLLVKHAQEVLKTNDSMSNTQEKYTRGRREGEGVKLYKSNYGYRYH